MDAVTNVLGIISNDEPDLGYKKSPIKPYMAGQTVYSVQGH